jgi:hypothetical protein
MGGRKERGLMERHGDGVAVPGQALPDYVAPEQAVPGQPVPERAAPGEAGTGDVRVDEALARLGDLDGLPVDEHPAVFEHVHTDLTAALGTLDSGPEDPSATSGARGTSVGPITPGS